MTLEEMAMLHLHNQLGLNDPRTYQKGSGGDVQAVNRITRTPTTFTNRTPDASVPNAVGIYDPITKGITINPTTAGANGSIPETIRHEAIHAALDKVPGYESITGKDPMFKGKDQDFMGGPAEREVPAYLGSYPVSQISQVSDDQRSHYLNSMVQNIFRQNPNVAGMLQRIFNQR